MTRPSYTGASEGPSPGNVPAGWLLAVASVLSLTFMTHHPSVGSATLPEMVAEISREAGISQIVHGVLIALLLAQYYGLLVLSLRLGLRRGPVLGALIAQSVGVLAMMGAALISGFITGDLAEHVLEAPEAMEIGRWHLEVSHMANQRLAQLGVITMGAAIALWSVVLLGRDAFSRLAGGVGVALGLLLAGSMVSGAMTLHVQGMTLVVATQVLWYLAVAVQLIRRAL